MGSVKACILQTDKTGISYTILGKDARLFIEQALLAAGISDINHSISLTGNTSGILFIRADAPLIASDTLENLTQNFLRGSRYTLLLNAQLNTPVCHILDIETASALVNDKEDIFFDELSSILACAELSAQTRFAKDGEGFFADSAKNAAVAGDILKRRINEAHMDNSVIITDPAFTYIDPRVVIEPGCTLLPGCTLDGCTRIGRGAVIGPHSKIADSEIGEDSVVLQSVVLESKVGSGTKIGPFSYIRPNSVIGSHVKIGDFVEVKNSAIGDNTSVSHLTYIGDSDVGRRVNFGCGTVTVNYDGHKKHRTTIEDGAFIGCNTNLVAPVTVKENAYIAAGSTITEEVPKDNLAIARARQVNKTGWKRK